MLRTKVAKVVAKRGATVASASALSTLIYTTHHLTKKSSIISQSQQKLSAHVSLTPQLSIPSHYASHNTLLFSTADASSTTDQSNPFVTEETPKETPSNFPSYFPSISALFTSSSEEDALTQELYKQQKEDYTKMLQEMTPDERIEFQRKETTAFRSRHDRLPATDSPVNKDPSLIDDGYQQVILPVRVLPNWHPMKREEVNGPLDEVRYIGEHIFDFFRNRVDDLGYAITGEIRDAMVDPSRYERSWLAKHPQIYLNSYYESVYRGWYDDTMIKMKLGGNIPRWDYSSWIRKTCPRPKIYLDFLIPDDEIEANNIEYIENKIPQRVILQLYGDICPESTENFVGLADGFIDSDRYLSYNNTLIHRIDRNHAFFCGDILRRDGSAGMAFNVENTQKFLKDENFKLKIDGPGCVVYDNRGKNTNTSHFFITQRAMPELDGQYVCFGHVIEGMDTVKKINNIPTNDDGVPLFPVTITRSGVFIENPQRDDPFWVFRHHVQQYTDSNTAQGAPTQPPQSAKQLREQYVTDN